MMIAMFMLMAIAMALVGPVIASDAPLHDAQNRSGYTCPLCSQTFADRADAVSHLAETLEWRGGRRPMYGSIGSIGKPKLTDQRWR